MTSSAFIFLKLYFGKHSQTTGQIDLINLFIVVYDICVFFLLNEKANRLFIFFFGRKRELWIFIKVQKYQHF